MRSLAFFWVSYLFTSIKKHSGENGGCTSDGSLRYNWGVLRNFQKIFPVYTNGGSYFFQFNLILIVLKSMVQLVASKTKICLKNAKMLLKLDWFEVSLLLSYEEKVALLAALFSKAPSKNSSSTFKIPHTVVAILLHRTDLYTQSSELNQKSCSSHRLLFEYTQGAD